MNPDHYKTLPPLLRSCWIRLNAIFQSRLQPIGITPDQYIALRWLHERKSQKTNQKILANLMFTDANNISNLISRMEKSRLIERFSCANDRRKKFLRATSFGLSKFVEAQPLAKSLERLALESINQNERKDFLQLMSKLNQFFKKG